MAEGLCRPLRGLDGLFCPMSHGLKPVATSCRALRALTLAPAQQDPWQMASRDRGTHKTKWHEALVVRAI